MVVVAPLAMAPIRMSVHIGMEPYLAILRKERTPSDFSFLEESATAMLEELAWWAKALRAARQCNAG